MKSDERIEQGIPNLSLSIYIYIHVVRIYPCSSIIVSIYSKDFTVYEATQNMHPGKKVPAYTTVTPRHYGWMDGEDLSFSRDKSLDVGSEAAQVIHAMWNPGR